MRLLPRQEDSVEEEATEVQTGEELEAKKVVPQMARVEEAEVKEREEGNEEDRQPGVERCQRRWSARQARQ